METYLSPIVLNSNENTEIVFGTGGETIGGKFFITSLADLINEDEVLDIITNSVDGRLLAFDGINHHRIDTQIPVYKKVKWGAYQGSNYDGILNK